MLFILFLFALFRTLQGSPLSSSNAIPNSNPFALGFRDIQSHLTDRGVNDIVVSCFATIFACTWSAIHPNVPAATDCWWTHFKRQLTTFVYALLAPELVTIWAASQRLDAQKIMDEYNEKVIGDRDDSFVRDSTVNMIRHLFHDHSKASTSRENTPRWTLSHAFFLIMGGFMLSDNGKPVRVMQYRSSDEDPEKLQLIPSIQQGIVDPPSITEVEIQDRSKGDAISKAIVVLQTTWFIMQCLARWSQHLPVTELEVVTLAFALLNGMTYAMWWYKPQSVECQVFLERKMIPDTPPNVDSKSVPVLATETSEAKVDAKDPVVAANELTMSQPIIDELHAASEKLDEPKLPHPRNMPPANNPPPSAPPTSSQKLSWTRRKLRNAIATKASYTLPFILPAYVFAGFLRPMFKLFSDDEVLLDRVPMFSTPYTSKADNGNITIPLIGALFGSVHLIPSWFLDFASHQEMWLWRASAIVITAFPLVMGVGINTKEHDFMGIIDFIVSLAIVIGIPLYVAARIVLLVLSLTSLRSLSGEALQTIEWTTFIPHL